MNIVNARLNRETPANPQKNTEPFWTAARVRILTTQWALGTRVRDIARLLGSTRNTVIGKARRMELPMHAGSVFHPDAPRKREEKKCKDVKPRAARGRVVRVRRVAAPFEPASSSSQPLPYGVPVPLRLPFAALEAQHCRYSVSAESPHFFCGHERKGKSAFCPFHHTLCYEPLRGRPTELPRRARNYARAA